MNDFEVKKRGKRTCEGGTTRIRLPASFVSKFSSKKGWDINSVIEQRYSLSEIKVQRNEFLCLDPQIMRQLFEPVLDGIMTQWNCLKLNLSSSLVDLLIRHCSRRESKKISTKAFKLWYHKMHLLQLSKVL